MNFLESYWTRKDQVAKLFAGFSYTDKEREHTVSAWAHSNLSIPEIKFLTNNADKKETADIKTKKDLRMAMAIEEEQLREGKEKEKEKEKKSNFNYNFKLKENFNFKGVDW